ncbi:MAG: helix-turn-helix transcriptional regulator [Rhodobacteraceae bacterium]|nr:helix-turn-helix transcriptional regulator [Paracoccaceae bacterium]
MALHRGEVPSERHQYHVLPISRLAKGGRWRTEGMRSYTHPTLLWFTRGQGRITLAGSTRGYGPHNLIFLPPRTMHGFDMTGQTLGTALFFPEDSMLPLPGAPVHLRVRQVQEQTELTSLMEHINREIDAGLPANDRALHHYAGLISVWLERQMAAEAPTVKSDNAARRLAAAFTNLLEAHFRTGRAVADYAEELGVTPTHLSRACRIACGQSASAIRADRVISEAKYLLADTRKPIKEIADELGFASAAYFTRAFQKHSGMTPSAFRRRGQA